MPITMALDSGENDHAQILAAMKALPASCLKVLAMCEVEKLTIEEAARRLGISRRTAEKRWMRAVELMTGRLER